MHQIAPTARVAFQGEPGAFSQIAARKLLGDGVQTVACPTFESLFDSIAEGRADLILAPLENTLAGPVLRCYDLLYQGCAPHDRRSRSAHQPLRHRMPRLIARGASPHPVASRRPGPVRALLRRPSRYHQGRCRRHRRQRASNHGAPRPNRRPPSPASSPPPSTAPRLLVSAVEDDPNNFTRFALLEPASAATEAIPDADATTLVLTVANQPGALFHSLEPFALQLRRSHEPGQPSPRRNPVALSLFSGSRRRRL